MRESADNLVIGGGPAGSMLALQLAAAGRNVILLEKQPGPHDKVCGEFLSREAIGYLQNAGIEPKDLGAEPIHRVRLHSGLRTIESHLPFTALSLSRRILDEALLERAASAGCSVRRGTFVQKLQPLDKAWRVQLRGDQVIEAKTVFVATGKHDLNEMPRTRGSQSDLVGFKMHWRLDPAHTEAFRSWMDLFLFRNGYGGLSLIENDIVNLCFVVRRARLRLLGGWTELLHSISSEVPGIGKRLHGATPCWTKPLAISPIPYGHLGGPANGLWRIGDQAAVIPSFTGDGMSIALHSAELAAEMYLAGNSPEDYLLSLANQLRPAMRLASALSLAMVTSPGRMIAPIALALKPDAMAWIANKTRIPTPALRVPHAQPNAHIRPSSTSLA